MLNAIYDGGGLRKQNGHYQSSIREGDIFDKQFKKFPYRYWNAGETKYFYPNLPLSVYGSVGTQIYKVGIYNPIRGCKLDLKVGFSTNAKRLNSTEECIWGVFVRNIGVDYITLPTTNIDNYRYSFSPQTWVKVGSTTVFGRMGDANNAERQLIMDRRLIGDTNKAEMRTVFWRQRTDIFDSQHTIFEDVSPSLIQNQEHLLPVHSLGIMSDDYYPFMGILPDIPSKYTQHVMEVHCDLQGPQEGDIDSRLFDAFDIDYDVYILLDAVAWSVEHLSTPIDGTCLYNVFIQDMNTGKLVTPIYPPYVPTL